MDSMTEYAQYAYDNGDLQGAPYSSAIWLAAVAADAMRGRGLPRPERVRMGRGYSVHIAAGRGPQRVNVHIKFEQQGHALQPVEIRTI